MMRKLVACIAVASPVLLFFGAAFLKDGFPGVMTALFTVLAAIAIAFVVIWGIEELTA